MRKFPPMPQCTSCGDCCGPVPVRPQEIARIKAFCGRRGIAWTAHLHKMACGFLDRASGRCRIYPVRPVACRMFGVIKEMPCPHFPQAVRLSFPAKAAVASGLTAFGDQLLGVVFEA